MGRKVRWWRCRLASWMVAARRTLSTKAATILHCTDSWPAQSSCTRTCLHHDSAEHCSGHVLAQASHARFDRSLRHPAGPCDRYLTSIPSLSRASPPQHPMLGRSSSSKHQSCPENVQAELPTHGWLSERVWNATSRAS